MAAKARISQGLELNLPERICRLDELANNLWWSWNPQARELFRALDYPLWRDGHNPVRQLRYISQEKLHSAAGDPAFLGLYDAVLTAFDADLKTENAWFDLHYPAEIKGPVAFFSMEFAIHRSLPLYAGGLGILAGDLCKESSDLGVPLVGVGFMYPQGYFRQCITDEGWQEERYVQIDFNEAPINPVLSENGSASLAAVYLDNRPVHIRAWEIQVGRTMVYLLDTNLEENSVQDRNLSARLYIADRTLRIQQEIVLGIGGVRILRALGIEPAVWHANEGHTAFMMMERVREEVSRGTPYRQALKQVQETTVFTTHTPVPAGHDIFPVDLVDRNLHSYWESSGISRDTFLRLGQDTVGTDAFNMTTFALRMSERRNAVSKLHGIVGRRMWNVLWPEAGENEVPITHVTNGVHVPTWVAPELRDLFEIYLGPNWLEDQDDPRVWERIGEIPDEEIWRVHLFLKQKLKAAILDWARDSWAECRVSPRQVVAMGSLLDAEALTIAFVRRFAEYKRPALIFQDLQRLKRLVGDRFRPLQIIFAGKSHPADFPSKYLLHQVYSLANGPEFQGRIAFIEDYDMHMARYLVHGVDVWLNVPRRLNEACGTSGMKAALNGVPHLSVRDGWWHEGYNGKNGWAIGDGRAPANSEEEDRADAEALYDLLEKEVVPLYYNRDRKGVPHGWIQVVKEAIRSVTPVFSARRMLKEYLTGYYLKAAGAAGPQPAGRDEQ